MVELKGFMRELGYAQDNLVVVRPDFILDKYMKVVLKK